MTTSLKSVFVTFYLVFLAAATIVAIVQIGGPDFSLGWIGSALTTAPFLIFLSWITITQRRARTSARLPSIMAFATLGAALAAWSWFIGFSGPAPALVALAGLGAFVAYVFWYSDLGPRRSVALTLGRALPDFDVKNEHGDAVASRSWRGQPSVLIFYRGNWCPLCMAQIKETAAHYREIEARGARVALISPQPPSHTRALAKKHDVKFEYYVDDANCAARVLGIDHPGGLPLGMQALGYASDTVLPTVIVVDKEGIVRWVHETDNYRVRPEPQTFLEALSAVSAA
ncbi:MAG: redoxin domain-containing protein [Hyphomonadaceae bacterium]|nr:redoxin domain-containing protein [Hyphomonadaceae bacterium]